MTFLPVLVHTIRFILKSGGKSDLTSDDLERSMTSITLNLTFFSRFCGSLSVLGIIRYVMIICCTSVTHV